MSKKVIWDNIINSCIEPPTGIDQHMIEIKKFCNKFPTCEGCPKNLLHTGCYFRGKSPRDWEVEE